MRFFSCILGLSLCVSTALVAQAPKLTELDIVERHTPDGPVALVEGSAIEKEAFLQLYHSRMAVLQKQLDKVNDAARIKTAYQSIGDLVKREILYVEGKKQKIAVADSAVEARLKEGLASQQENAKKAGAAPLSESELLAESGKTREELLASVKKSMIIDKMKEQITTTESGEPTQKEIKEFYDKRPELFRKSGGYHIQQIFIQPKPNAAEASDAEWEKTRKAVEKGLARIKAGESFEAVAKDISEAKDKKNGGDMGVLSDKDLPEFVVAEVRKLKTGEMSGVVKSTYGCHIFKLLGTEKEDAVSLADATPKIKEALLQARGVNSVDAFTNKIMQDTQRVSIYLKLEKAIASLSKEELDQLRPEEAPAKK